MLRQQRRRSRSRPSPRLSCAQQHSVHRSIPCAEACAGWSCPAAQQPAPAATRSAQQSELGREQEPILYQRVHVVAQDTATTGTGSAIVLQRVGQRVQGEEHGAQQERDKGGGTCECWGGGRSCVGDGNIHAGAAATESVRKAHNGSGMNIHRQRIADTWTSRVRRCCRQPRALDS